MKNLFRSKPGSTNGAFIPIATKLMLSFLLIIVIMSVVFMVVGIQLISDRVVEEAQEKVRNDLNTAREIYLGTLAQIETAVRFTADRFFISDLISQGNIDEATEELIKIQTEAGLDFLTITDEYGYVILRTSNISQIGDNLGSDEIVQVVLLTKRPAASTIIVPNEDLFNESALLAEQAYFEFIDTPLARDRKEIEETAGMVLKAAAPIFDINNNLIGVAYGGVLLNKNYEIVDKVKQTVYQDVKYEGQDIGTATIFQDDVRISTNVKNEDGSRAIGTRVSEEVYNQVVLNGQPWIGRAYVVNNWHITAYEPITDVYGRIIGILYVGVLEQKYNDIKSQTIVTFLAITLVGVVVSLAVSYFISQRILVPIDKLVSASKEVAQGNLDAKVEIKTNDELDYLAESFNAMALSLKRRDEQLKEFATQKIMESERLALIGQLSANVAHELNNPLQGIVAYSYLLLEGEACTPERKDSIKKIVGQADRCRDIIRGLLDFSRQRKPDKTLCNINSIMQESLSLLENQALFHNIEIERDFQDNLPLLVIDPSQIERVFINLAVNAAEAMDGSGTLTLVSQHDPFTGFVEVSVTDTGQGIAKENIDNIFDPFFTTKDVGHGTGLGLAISYGIVKGHRGTISVESEPGIGTSFKVRLPIKGKQEASDDGRQS